MTEKNKWKKVLIWVCVVAISLSLVGCGNIDTQPPPEQETITQETKPDDTSDQKISKEVAQTLPEKEAVKEPEPESLSEVQPEQPPQPEPESPSELLPEQPAESPPIPTEEMETPISEEIVEVGETHLEAKGADSSTLQDEEPKDNPETGTRASKMYLPAASGNSVESDNQKLASIDYSNASQGYVMVKYDGSISKVKLLITGPDGYQYKYNLTPKGGYNSFGLTAGSGSYKIEILENVTGNQYALVLSKTIKASLENNLLPFLYPNQWVSFSSGNATIKKATELAAPATTDAAVVESIYNYVVKNITYDVKKADYFLTHTGYLCNIDQTLSSGTGICLDYATVMAAMLRSQGIPTKMEVGYVGGVYHSWVKVYVAAEGTVNKIIPLKANTWTLLDPTFASNMNDASLKQFIGNGSGYQLEKVY